MKIKDVLIRIERNLTGLANTMSEQSDAQTLYSLVIEMIKVGYTLESDFEEAKKELQKK